MLLLHSAHKHQWWWNRVWVVLVRDFFPSLHLIIVPDPSMELQSDCADEEEIFGVGDLEDIVEQLYTIDGLPEDVRDESEQAVISRIASIYSIGASRRGSALIGRLAPAEPIDLPDIDDEDDTDSDADSGPEEGASSDGDCLICLCPIEASCWQCPASHLFCVECLVQYVRERMSTHDTTFTCPGDGCSQSIDDGVLALILPVDMQAALGVLRRKKQDPSLRECPRCRTLVEGGSASAPALTCPQCTTQFCFVHGTSLSCVSISH